MKSEALPSKTIIKELDFLRKTVIIPWSTWRKDLLLLANKLIEKIPYSRNATKHYQSFIRKNATKSKKQSNIITFELKTFKNPVDIKSIITENAKTSRTLSKTMRQAEKVGSNSPFYSDTKKWTIFKWKKYKNNKTSTCV